ncbi:MAG: hypothetical protein M0R46_08800 [Candidatus Muirbacterium halophilum]|nr:hypothetical protein [Candidatus Muirbacterium halophilum]MCK9476003.1 hypothetical protein [Candidatus Muirbacterium halophilum]
MVNLINSSNSSVFRNLNNVTLKASKLSEQLSSGKRITGFNIDAAGGAIAEKMRAQFSQYEQEISNYEDNINRYKTEEGAYTGISENLQEIRKLQVQARNDTLTDEDKQKIQNQIDLQVESMKFIADSAEFNTKKLVKPGEELSKIFKEGISATGEFVDKALKEVVNTRSELGAKVNTTEKNIDGRMIAYENTVAAYSTIADMDIAKGMVEKAQNDIMSQVGVYNIKNLMNISKQSVLNLL